MSSHTSAYNLDYCEKQLENPLFYLLAVGDSFCKEGEETALDNLQIFIETIEQYKFAYNYTCKVGWKAELWNGVELHKLTYYTVRDKTSLPSQLVISARVVATESLKSAIKRKRKELKSRCPESKNPAIRYDKRSYTVWLDREEISLSTIEGRQKFKIEIPDYFKQYLDWKVTSANLKYDKRLKKFFLNITVEKEVGSVQYLV